MDYVEILSESRGLEIGPTSSEQKITIQFKLPEDDEGEFLEPVYDKAEFMNATDDVLALELAYSLIPLGRWLPDYNGQDVFLVLDKITLDQVDNYGWWKATATYIFDANTGQGGPRAENPVAITLPFIKIGFSVGNVTRRITQSLELKSFCRNNENNVILVDQLPGTIGQTEDGIIGADIYAAGLQLQITAYYYPQYVTYGFLKYLADLCPSVNADSFLTFPPGTCLMLGADGQAVITDIVPIVYTVEVKPNIIDLPDPPFDKITMEGHDVLDYRYLKEIDEALQGIAQQPVERRIHRVYQKAVFATLGFPTQ